MTDSAQLRALAVTALVGNTLAGQNVFSAKTWPTWSGQYPVLYLHTPKERKESLGPNAPQFTVTTTLRISARVRKQPTADGVGAERATEDLEQMYLQIQKALINNPALMRSLQQFPFIDMEMDLDGMSSDSDVGEMVVDVGMEFYQGPEDFYPIELDDLEQVAMTVDAVNVVDKTGTYPDPPFPNAVTPAPRTEGPDGRAEGGMTFNFSNEE